MSVHDRLAWWLVGSSAVVAGGLFVFGMARGSEAYGAAGALGLVVSMAATGLLTRSSGGNGALPEIVTKLQRDVHDMTRQAALSDDARRVLNRRTERDLLCRAIDEDIQREDWDAATVLCDELANSFGYRHEAETFRERISTGCAETIERAVSKAIAFLDGLVIQRKWEEAFEEAARILRLYSESPRARNLHERVEAAREQFKIDLERRFLLTAEAERVDEAMDLLKQLDQYLTPEEAERFTEVARGVIGKARENLGVRFKLAVHDHRWEEAAMFGTQIIEQFPNTRMAAEVRELLGEIRSRSSGVTSVG